MLLYMFEYKCTHILKEKADLNFPYGGRIPISSMLPPIEIKQSEVQNNPFYLGIRYIPLVFVSSVIQRICLTHISN